MRKAGKNLFYEDFSRFRYKVIDVLNVNNLDYWTKELNCSQEILLKAISTVGNNVMLINDWLILNRLRREFDYN